MPCGCQKGKSLPPLQRQVVAPPPVTAARVAVYTVVKDGKDVLTSSSPSKARSEAQRLGGSIKVGSREVTAGDPVPV